ncbi:MAG: AMP-binding protein [Rhizobiaceae bacterium]
MSTKFDYVPSADTRRSGQSTLAGMFRASAQSHTNLDAIVEGDKALTYAEVDDQSGRLARLLLDEGLETGDRVGILARNCSEYLLLELAAAKCGVIVAALNWRLSDPELTHCINLVSPKLVLAQQDYVPTLHRLEIEQVPVIELGETFDQRISTCHPMPPMPLDSAGGGGESGESGEGGEAGLVILYTSGTTGMPKGALISHRAMIARAACFVSDLNLPRGSNFVAWAPLFHMASTDHSLATLLRGGTVFVVDGYQPEVLMDLIEAHTVGWFVLMPGMVGEFAEFCRARRLKPKGIVACGAMADLVPREEIAAATTALSTPYVNSFGATETGLPPATASVIDIGEAPERLPKRQSAFVELRLVDAEDNDVALGEPGEVALRGPTLFSGYWRAEETNAHDFRNGWFHMGDVMRRNLDGTLEYVDRVKYMIKSGGENIYPAEIEQVLSLNPDISEAVVVRRRDAKWGEVPVAFVVSSRPGLSEEQVIETCRGKLASYKLPKQVLFIDEGELPRSTTGKVQRHELEKRL